MLDRRSAYAEQRKRERKKEKAVQWIWDKVWNVLFVRQVLQDGIFIPAGAVWALFVICICGDFL